MKMFNLNSISLSILFCLFFFYQTNAQLFINEVQSSNNATIADNFLEYDDWIELYNPTNTAIDIAGYFITDDLADPLKKQFKFGSPSLTTVPANGYLLLWADDDEEQGTNHLNFKLDASGDDTVYLIDDDQTTIIDSLKVVAIPSDQTLCRKPDGDLNIFESSNATPASSNATNTAILPMVNFSKESGVYANSQNVKLSSTISGVKIYYTLDGSDPDANSLLYNNRIVVSNHTNIKAIAIKSGFENSWINTQTFIIGYNTNLPIVNLTANPTDLYSDNSGILVEGTNGIIGYCSGTPQNYNQDWEVPANFTYFENNQLIANEDIGIKVGGNCAKRKNQTTKALTLYFRDEYSRTGDNELNHQLFEDNDIDHFKRVYLRSASHSTTQKELFNDLAIHRLVNDKIDVETQSGKPVVLFINGVYEGIIHMREKFDKAHLKNDYPKIEDKRNIDAIKNPGRELIGDKWWPIERATEGDTLEWHQFMEDVKAVDLSIDNNYVDFRNRIDENTLMNWLIAGDYFAMTDWVTNNVKVWKEKGPENKWRWCLVDFDSTLKLDKLDYSSFENEVFKNFSDHPDCNILYKKLFENDRFKNELIQRYITYVNNVFTPNNFNNEIDLIYNEILPELPTANSLTNYTIDSYQNIVQANKDFVLQRKDYAINNLKTLFTLEDSVRIKFNFTSSTNGSVVLHENYFKIPESYQGYYFRNIPLMMHAVPKPGYRFVEWQEISNTNQKYQQNLHKSFGGNKTVTPIFESALDVVINEIYYNPNGTNEDEEFIELYNPDSEAKNLRGYQFTNGIEFQFPENSEIQAGEYMIIAHNDSAYVGKGYQVFEWTSGSLDNDGEAIVFSNPANEVIDSVYYNDNIAWNQSADGLGFSLALLDNVNDNNLPTSWSEQRPSLATSPGQKNDFCTAIQNTPTVTNISCFGANDGFIINNITGGTPPLSYNWSNGQNNEIANSLSAGLHILTTTDLYNCARIDSFTITEPTQLKANKSSTNETYFQANDGTASVTANGGSAPYSYNWSNGENTSAIGNLSAGTYTVDIVDQNFCSITKTINIQGIDCSGLSLNVTSTDETYFQTNDGTALATASGGTAPYTYTWSNGTSNSSNNNLAAGTYSVEVADQKLCKTTKTVSINPLVCNPLAVDVNVQNETCAGENNASLSITNIQNGTAPYSIQWSTGATLTSINNLPSDTYQLTINDAKGCPFSNSYLVSNATTLSANTIITDASTSAANDGAIELNLSGGTAPYTYYWSNGASTQNLNNMVAGTYWLSITDANNCQLVLTDLRVGNNCVDNLIYSNQPQHTTGIYQAADYILSNGLIQFGENVSFKANNYIELDNDFEVIRGGDFEVQIEGCD